ncbi:helix-turn-helix domain-containing protein [Sphingobacterium composti Ten et al. 2007 non Yoo et al. 2007]|uniref:helix-turn-helix domain-containing protein n=1 Tax=Sphingobacterium composti TaxID=363260 RepID=UPI001F2B3A94|nr:helix-turn-helix transcriptional regulator [Sphingobacterium composti Ten et al. 2007 non Yoo et al. 2007]
MSEVIFKSRTLLGDLRQNFKIMTFSKFREEVDYYFGITYKVNCYSILIITSGQSKFDIDFKSMDVHVGDVMFISPGQIFQCASPDTVEGYLISFSDTFFNSYSNAECFKFNMNLLNRLSQTMHMSLSDKKQKIVKNLIGLLKMDAEDISGERFTIIRQHLISVLLQTLKFEKNTLESGELLSGDRKLAIKYKNLVQKNISVKNNVEYFCKELNVSKSTLQKATRVAFQKSPKDIIQEVLMLEAQRLLFVSRNRVQEIAYTLGFTDPTNFTKFFKKSAGTTPDAFRKKQLKANLSESTI